jgi:hypothetical protein
VKFIAMKKEFTISISKPCSERWNSFTPTSQGGFCSSCNKNVIDFTNKSDGDILNFIQNKTSHTCGRFRPDQLKLYAHYSPTNISPGLTLLKAGFVSAMLLLVSRQTSAQTVATKSKVEVVQYSNQPTEERIATNADHFIKGVVKSGEDNQPLAGINVIRKGHTEGTVTDLQGRFEFPVAVNEGDVLVFTFIGLKTQEYVVRKDTAPEVVISMEMYCDIMGEIAVDKVYTKNESSISKVWTKIKGWF